jgi:hypothetical protein
MNLLDAVNDVESLQIDPAEVTTKDCAVYLSAAPDAIYRSEADVEAVASQASSSLTLALARYIDNLGLDQGIDLMAEAQRFERGVIERALELTRAVCNCVCGTIWQIVPPSQANCGGLTVHAIDNRSKGSQKRAAKLLGLNSSTLNTKIKKYGLKANRRNPSGR